MTDFAGKNVLITGAASGMGRIMADKIAAEGGRVILWDINQQGCDEAREALTGRGHQAAAYRCDLSSREAIYAAAAQVLENHGPLDILINNAGVVSGKPLLEIPDQMIERTFAVNALALFWTTRAFLPAMIERNSGHIVTISSGAGIIGTPRLVDYCASKFAAFGFDEALRVELQRAGYAIRTTVVVPYFVNTGMFTGVKTRFPWLLPIMEPEEVVDKILKAIRRNRRRLIMPPFAYVVFPARLLSPVIMDKVAGFFGINRTMDEFVGR